MDRYPYKIYAPSGRLLCQATERYDRKTERSIIAAGNTIKLRDKVIGKPEPARSPGKGVHNG